MESKKGFKGLIQTPARLDALCTIILDRCQSEVLILFDRRPGWPPLAGIHKQHFSCSTAVSHAFLQSAMHHFGCYLLSVIGILLAVALLALHGNWKKHTLVGTEGFQNGARLAKTKDNDGIKSCA